MVGVGEDLRLHSLLSRTVSAETRLQSSLADVEE